jgi:type II secretory pathway component GspD/PulD (secretin)
MRTWTLIATFGMLAAACAEKPAKTPGEKTEEVLGTKRIDLSVTEGKIEDVASFFGEVGGVRVLVDPAAAAEAGPVTCILQDMLLKDVIDVVLGAQNMKSVNRNGTLIWTTAKKAPELERRPLPGCPEGASEEEKKVWKRASGMKLSVNFTETPANEVLSFIQEISGIPVVVETGRAAPVSLRIGESTLVDLLDWMAFQLGGRLTVRAGTLVITEN